MNNIPNYISIFTCFMILLPLMLFISIGYAKKKQIKKHIISQCLILVIALGFILYFEVMVRLDGGFLKYINDEKIPFIFVIVFMIIHILLAIAAIAGWLFLFIKSIKEYKARDFITFSFNHKRIGYSIFIVLTISVFMGFCIYLGLLLL